MILFKIKVFVNDFLREDMDWWLLWVVVFWNMFCWILVWVDDCDWLVVFVLIWMLVCWIWVVVGFVLIVLVLLCGFCMGELWNFWLMGRGFFVLVLVCEWDFILNVDFWDVFIVIDEEEDDVDIMFFCVMGCFFDI